MMVWECYDSLTQFFYQRVRERGACLQWFRNATILSLLVILSEREGGRGREREGEGGRHVYGGLGML